MPPDRLLRFCCRSFNWVIRLLCRNGHGWKRVSLLLFYLFCFDNLGAICGSPKNVSDHNTPEYGSPRGAPSGRPVIVRARPFRSQSICRNALFFSHVPRLYVPLVHGNSRRTSGANKGLAPTPLGNFNNLPNLEILFETQPILLSVSMITEKHLARNVDASASPQ